MDTELLGGWFPDGGNAIVIDEDLWALIREWKIEEHFAPPCQQCDIRLPSEGVPPPQGSTRGSSTP
ncbi:hypothetical protein ABZ464_47975 [Streptomyces sp. NPDC005820]|uniref:hypothetical protein n=1 Tax=Streptomyces sp. NPDC005820 TaxID=3157069 RepID=UPI0033C14BB7